MLTAPNLLQTAQVMDSVALAREDSVCQMLQDVALANGWETERECGVPETRERIDLVAWKPLNSVIIEVKKGYAPSNFLDHVAQAARYGTRYNDVMIANTRNDLERSKSAADRRARIGRAIGSIFANDVLLVCPGFDETKAAQHASEAADQGVLVVNTVDAALYLSGHHYTGVTNARRSFYQQAKARLSAPTIAEIMAIE